jgi:hypothetical protein
VNAGDRLSEQIASFIDKATDVVEKVADQFVQDFNPLLDQKNDNSPAS